MGRAWQDTEDMAAYRKCGSTKTGAEHMEYARLDGEGMV